MLDSLNSQHHHLRWRWSGSGPSNRLPRPGYDVCEAVALAGGALVVEDGSRRISKSRPGARTDVVVPDLAAREGVIPVRFAQPVVID